jgi:hypothetical protein
LIASDEKQRKYQRDVPHVDVPAELFNQWEECYFPDDGAFQGGFSEAELKALTLFDEAFKEVCDATPQELPSLEEFIATEAWRKLSAAAGEALKVMS